MPLGGCSFGVAALTVASAPVLEGALPTPAMHQYDTVVAGYELTVSETVPRECRRMRAWTQDKSGSIGCMRIVFPAGLVPAPEEMLAIAKAVVAQNPLMEWAEVSETNIIEVNTPRSSEPEPDIAHSVRVPYVRMAPINKVMIAP